MKRSLCCAMCVTQSGGPVVRSLHHQLQPWFVLLPQALYRQDVAGLWSVTGQ